MRLSIVIKKIFTNENHKNENQIYLNYPASEESGAFFKLNKAGLILNILNIYNNKYKV